ncbi:MAG: GTPase activator [Micromonospora sp.]
MSERNQAMSAAPDDRDPRETREAEEAHGGSMAPGLVDDTGHPLAEPPSAAVPEPPATEAEQEPSAMGTPGEDGTGS